MLNKLYTRLEEIYPDIIAIRRDFHMYPELSFKEVRTPQKIAEFHSKLGLEVRTGVGGRGVVATLRGARPGKTVALRADFDALPIQDEKDVEYKSKVPGVMHACGHDAHTATMLGLAKALSGMRENIQGNIVFIHQFAEELAPGGAISMVEDGCLDGVDVIFGTHFLANLPTGKIGYREGAIMAAADRFEIEVIGRGGHGAAPHETIDSIIIGSQLVNNLQQIVSRRIDPTKPAVVTVGQFNAGDAFNIIAEKAKIIGTVRTFDEKIRNNINQMIEQITAATCQAYGATYKYTYEYGYPVVQNNSIETRILVESAKKVIKEDDLFEIDLRMGGEDFAYYLHKVPGTFFFTGAGNKEAGVDYPLHHPKFNIDEKAMLVAAKVLGTVALDYLQG
ncbi:peptidase M20 [Vulcanibacillus modesticaldus]|uniref:Peptidase M20 n=1 Tax=Vulcanibacillus modesticaldus TaxID=337097 RepID=A0A1D2YXS8_9BACI|nr:M20 family metallopeptidase [Vulcanibacillus modesticaldus]OEG00386.1 peptidase M20 [Vulcanibacillus modesticaldus]